MPRFHENFVHSGHTGNFRIGDIVILAIVALSVLSITWQTSAAIDGEDKEKDKKAMMCLKEYK